LLQATSKSGQNTTKCFGTTVGNDYFFYFFDINYIVKKPLSESKQKSNRAVGANDN